MASPYNYILEIIIKFIIKTYQFPLDKPYPYMIYSIQENKRIWLKGIIKMKDIETCKIEKMPYKRYKASYSDCETIPGTYNKIAKTIDVVIPEDRIKKSGTRHQTYKYMWFEGIEHETNRKVSICIKATCLSNAIKRLPTNCDWGTK